MTNQDRPGVGVVMLSMGDRPGPLAEAIRADEGVIAAYVREISQFGLPIHAIGVGESIDDLQPFDPDEFARALTGLPARSA